MDISGELKTGLATMANIKQSLLLALFLNLILTQGVKAQTKEGRRQEAEGRRLQYTKPVPVPTSPSVKAQTRPIPVPKPAPTKNQIVPLPPPPSTQKLESVDTQNYSYDSFRGTLPLEQSLGGESLLNRGGASRNASQGGALGRVKTSPPVKSSIPPTQTNQPSGESTSPPKQTNQPSTEPTLEPALQTENSDEFNTYVDQQQAEQQSDSVVPKTEQNPFLKPDIDKLIQQQFSEDMWRIMRGGLSCLETSAVCLEQLQSKSVTQSPLLRELDTRIAEANEKINAAKAQNKKSIRLGVLTPALQYLLGPTVNPGQRQPAGTGLIDNIAAVIRGDTSILNGLLRVIGIPLFEGSQGGNADAQRNAIAISDLQIKVAELQRGRAKLADEIREKVAAALVRFDEAKTSFQTSQVVASRATDQFKVFELRYTRGNSDTESYLSRLNSLDNQKAQTYQAWAKMRRSLFELKLLVLSVKDAEI
jgi:hypothetical protein